MEGPNGEGKFTKFEVRMLVSLILLIAPHVLNAVKKLGRIYMSLSSVGMCESTFKEQEQSVPQGIVPLCPRNTENRDIYTGVRRGSKATWIQTMLCMLARVRTNKRKR